MFITGEKFIELSDFVYNIRIPNHDDYYNLKNTFNKNDIENFDGIPIIYCHTHLVEILFSIIKNINKEIVLITHNSDNNIDEKLTRNFPSNIIKWYSQNVNIIHNRIESIPIGLENSIWFPNINKIQKIKDISNKKFKFENLLYINHNINTNPKERQEPYIIFKNKSFTTLVDGRNGQDFDSYVMNIKTHKFILSPNGNGIDTHRLWESLYIGTIPIVKNGINVGFYDELPICYVDDWNEINEDFLNKEYERIYNTKWNLEKLDFNFWKNKIKNV
jgi:hypothetical protein